MFCFNFHKADVDVDLEERQVDDKQEDCAEEPCREILVSNAHREYIFKSISVNNVEFFLRDLESESEEANGKFMISYRDCDIIPTIYEGGLKVWECTYDLLSFLITNDVNFENKNVLDLGCGCGLLGIFASMRGAKVVHFQDFVSASYLPESYNEYPENIFDNLQFAVKCLASNGNLRNSLKGYERNADVLHDFTIPNVRLNKLKSVVKFFNGDWRNFLNLSSIENIEYDCILSSETLYSTKNYPNLYKLFVSKLRNHGEIFVASKSFYFGVGGSVQQFREYLSIQKCLRLETVWKTFEGVQREILCIKKSS